MTIPREQVAEVWPSSRPAEDPILFGHARISPEGAFEARSLQTFELTYTCGRYGLDDSARSGLYFVLPTTRAHCRQLTLQPQTT